MHILEQQYFRNVRPGERSFKRGSQYGCALQEATKASDALTDTLNEEQKALFEAYEEAQREVHNMTDVETFSYSFKNGGKIVLDVLENGEMDEI